MTEKATTQPKSRQIQPKMRHDLRDELNKPSDRYAILASLQQDPAWDRRRRLQTEYGMRTIMKTMLILLLFDLLLNGKEVDRTEFCKNNAISVRTFYRYLQGIDDYLHLSQKGLVLRNDRGAAYRLCPEETDDAVTPDDSAAETNEC